MKQLGVQWQQWATAAKSLFFRSWPTHGNALSPSLPVDEVWRNNGCVLFVIRKVGANLSCEQILRGLSPFFDYLSEKEVFLFVQRSCTPFWDPEKPPHPRQELVRWAGNSDLHHFQGVISSQCQLDEQALHEIFLTNPKGLMEWAAEKLETVLLDTNNPYLLSPCTVHKPWGREVWFSGMEARGHALIQQAQSSVPLGEALSLFPGTLMRQNAVSSPILLKILETVPDPQLGCMYMEVHRTKWEAYLVLGVNPQCWEQEKGLLLAAIKAEVLGLWRDKHPIDWENKLIAFLVEKFQRYYELRTQIDEMKPDSLVFPAADQVSHSSNDWSQAPMPAYLLQYRAWLDGLDDTLKEQEKTLKQDIEQHFEHHSLALGDIAHFPMGVLHSLKQGMRVLEFQNPSFERLIALSSQKVHTQKEWDIESALKHMQKTTYQLPTPKIEQQEAGICVELLTDAPDFVVHRYTLSSGTRFTLPQENTYQMLFVVEGEGQLLSKEEQFVPYVLEPEKGWFLPASLSDITLAANASSTMQCVIVHPKLSKDKTSQPPSN